MKKILIVVIILLVIILISSMGNQKLKKENTIYTENKNFFEAPIQKEASGEKEQIIIGGKEITIKKLYSYEVSGRVVQTYEYKDYYYGDETYNTIAKKDVGIVWGNLVQDDILKNIKFSMNGARFLKYTYRRGDWKKKLGAPIKKLCSNNHLISDDETITSLIKQINKHDYIKISGYLINAYWGNSYLTTSISRDDEGNGACEVVYVTDIKWYK